MLGGAIVAIVGWIGLGLALLAILYAISWCIAGTTFRHRPRDLPQYPETGVTDPYHARLLKHGVQPIAAGNEQSFHDGGVAQ